MRGEAFAFAHWCRLQKFTHEFGWSCGGCRYEWYELQKKSQRATESAPPIEYEYRAIERR